MKTKHCQIVPFIFSAALLATMLCTGCASFGKKGESSRTIKKYAVALPPGWTVVAPIGDITAPLSETSAYANFPATDTNTDKGFLGLRPVVFLAYKETWTDANHGGGNFLFTDPNAAQIGSAVQNQAALAGSHSFTVGSIQSVITSNAVSAITAGSSGVGNIIGAAARAAGKP